MRGKPFTLLVDIPLKPGWADEFMALFNEVFEAMKVEETFISATALRGAEDPDTILLCENWIDRENFMSVQLKRPYRHRYEARLPELLRSPRKLSFFEPIRPRPIAVFGERRIPPTISNGKSASVYQCDSGVKFRLPPPAHPSARVQPSRGVASSSGL